jgi:hypothetical protein
MEVDATKFLLSYWYLDKTNIHQIVLPKIIDKSTSRSFNRSNRNLITSASPGYEFNATIHTMSPCIRDSCYSGWLCSKTNFKKSKATTTSLIPRTNI